MQKFGTPNALKSKNKEAPHITALAVKAQL